MDSESTADLERIWQNADVWKFMPDDCFVIRADDEWQASRRRRAADFAKLKDGPSLDELNALAVDAALRAGWTRLAEEPEFQRTVFRKGELTLRIWVATELLLMMAGLPRVLRVDLFEPATAMPPFAPSPPAQHLLHRRLGLSVAPSRLRREHIFGLRSLVAEDLIESYDFPQALEPASVDCALGPRAEGKWTHTFSAQDENFTFELDLAEKSVAAKLTISH